MQSVDPSNPHPTPFDTPSTVPLSARLRSGTAARLAGVPVATLRVWERRYSVVAAPKTPTGQRLYSAHDVLRLRLLRQLTDGGHAIGTVAGLDLPSLQALATRTPAMGATAVAVQVIGRLAAHRLSAATEIQPDAVHDDLDHAEQAHAGAPADVLLAHLTSLQPASAARLLALGRRLQVRSLVVLYAYGAEAVADSLRAAGAVVRREPVDGRELATLVCAAPRPAPAALPSAPPAARTPAAIEPRRFTDEALSTIAQMPSAVACECQRHVAELVVQLAAFERYSADCTSTSPADAALHRQLSELAASTRSRFERALQRVMAHGGVDAPPPPAQAL